MPELPEVETIRRGLAKELHRARIADFNVRDQRLLPSKQAKRWQRRLVGQSFQAFQRQGKYLELILTDKTRFYVHLRMTGHLLVLPSGQEPAVLWRMRLKFSDGRALFFVDQRRFGEIWLLNPKEAGPSRTPLGPDALDIPLAHFKSQVGKKRGPIQAVLLDQAVLAGVGNIYAQEALFRSGIRPTRPAYRLTSKQTSALHDALQTTLHDAIKARGSTSRNYRDVYGKEGSAQITHAVYRKTGRPCLRCGESLRGMRVGGRGTVFCPKCQS